MHAGLNELALFLDIGVDDRTERTLNVGVSRSLLICADTN